jgi:hypothetical protein
MTRKELICIASASGVSFYGMGKDRERFMDRLQRFADMVLAAQPSPGPDSAKVKLFNDRMALTEEALTAMKVMAAAEEREACARVCEEQSEIYAVPVTSADYQQMWDECAAAIRARGQA